MIIAVLAAIAAGCSFSIGAVLQQSAARQAPTDEALSWRLLADLARRRTWLAGIGSDAVSFGLQALALAFGPLALVQPLLVCGLLFAMPMAARMRHRRLGAREWTGTVAVAAGIAAFLASAVPAAGTGQPSTARWIWIVASVAGLMAIATLAGRTARGSWQASLYGVAAGTAFGLLAALTKTSTSLLGDGAATFFTAWQPYGMAVVAVMGAIVQQSAFQAGPLATSLPLMDALEPTVATVIGIVAFGETVSASPASLAVLVIGVVLLIAGIVVLDTSPLVAELQARKPRRRDGPSANSRNAGAGVADEAH